LSSWSLVIPIFDGPDEPHHWLFARYLNEKKSLPVFSEHLVEANSPPLYYLLIAPVAVSTRVPARSVDKDGHLTPYGVHVVLGRAESVPKIYDYDRTDFARYWPIRTARLVTVGMSVLTIFFLYLAGRESTGRAETGYLAASLVAFLPQFSFRGSQVSNDALVATMAAVSLYALVRIVRRGFTPLIGLLAGGAIAGAYLTKINAIFLPVPLGLTLLTEKCAWRQHLLRVMGLASLMLALFLPWTVRNIALYGDPFAKNVMHQVVSGLLAEKSLTSPYFYTVFPSQLSKSFVGMFGWMNLWLPLRIYLLYALIGLLAGSGLLWGWMQHRIERRLIVILASMPLLNLLIVIYINLSFSQPQGRFMFPALPAIGLLAALGLENLPRWGRSVQIAFIVGLAAINVFILTFWLIPAYWS